MEQDEIDRLIAEQEAREAADTERTRTAAGWQLPGELASIGQGLSLGFLDEGAAGMRALADEGLQAVGLREPRPFADIYNEGLNAQRVEYGQAQERNPVATTAGEVAGGLLPLITTLGGSSAISAPSMARLAGIGAAGGAAGGFGFGEGGFDNRMRGAAMGAGIGAAAGPVMMGAGNAAGSVARAVRDTLGINPARTAAERVARSLGHDEIPQDSVVSHLQRAQGDGRGDTLLDAAGPNTSTMALAEAVAQRPGPRMRQMSEMVEERVAEAPARIADDFQRALGGVERDFYSSINELDAARRATARPLYDEAFSAHTHGMWSDGLRQMWEDDPIIQRALRDGYEIIRRENLASGAGRTDPRGFGITSFNDAGDPVIGMQPTLRAWDAVKRGLDNILDGYRDSTTGRLALDQRGRSVDALRRRLIEEVDSLAPEYAAARAAWAGPSQLMDAAALGRDFGRRDPNEIRRILRPMSESQRDAYLTGVYESLTDRISRVQDGADATRRVWGNERQRDQLRAVIEAISGSDAEARAVFAQLDDALSRENTFAQTRNQITRNSSTARRTYAQEMLTPMGVGFGADMLASAGGIPMTGAGLATGAAVGARNVVRRNADERTQAAIGDLLMSRDPAAVQEALGGAFPPGLLASVLGTQPQRQIPAFGLLGGLTAQDQPGLLLPR